MRDVNYYYRFQAIALDWSSEKDIKKHTNKLNSFDDLTEQLGMRTFSWTYLNC